MAGTWGVTPADSIAAACERSGRSAVVRGCITLIRGGVVSDELLLALGGPHAARVLAGREGGPGGYWPRVWAARGLFHAWDGGATAAIVEATADEAWRVREMAARTIGRHHVGDGLEAVANLLEDPVPRVRTAARTALERLVAARD